MHKNEICAIKVVRISAPRPKLKNDINSAVLLRVFWKLIISLSTRKKELDSAVAAFGVNKRSKWAEWSHLALFFFLFFFSLLSF